MNISAKAFARRATAIAGTCAIIAGGIWFAQQHQFMSQKPVKANKAATTDAEPLAGSLFIVTGKSDVSPYGGYTVMYSLDENVNQPGEHWDYDVNVGLDSAKIQKEMKTLPAAFSHCPIVQSTEKDKDLAAKADYTIFLFAHGGDYDVLMQNVYLTKQAKGYEFDYTGDVPASVISQLVKQDFVEAINSSVDLGQATFKFRQRH